MFTIYYSDEKQYREFLDEYQRKGMYYFLYDELGFAGNQQIHNLYDDTDEDMLNLIIDLDANDSTLQFLEEKGFEIIISMQFDYDNVRDGLRAYNYYAYAFKKDN